MSERLEAAERFVEVWSHSGLAGSLIDDYTCHLGCGEAEALAGLFRAFGHPSIAKAIIEDHSKHDDDPDDDHYSGSEN